MLDEEACGYDANFADEIPEHLKCVICHMVLKDAMQLAACGHRYCKQCFNVTKRYAERSGQTFSCPIDRETVDMGRVFDDKATQRLILDLRVFCHHQNNGCRWSGELRDLDTHLKRYCNGEKEKTKQEELIESLKREISEIKEQNEEETKKLKLRAFRVEVTLLVLGVLSVLGLFELFLGIVGMDQEMLYVFNCILKTGSVIGVGLLSFMFYRYKV